MQRLLEFYNNLTIKRKFIGIILLTILLFSCVCLSGLQIVNQANQKLLSNTIASSLSVSALEIKGSLDEIEAISFQMITDSVIQEQLGKVKSLPDDMLIRSNAYKQLNTSIQNYNAQNSIIHYISLLGEGIYVDTYSVWDEKIPEGSRLKMRQRAIEAEGRLKWVYHDDAEILVFAVRSIRQIEPYSLDTLGVILINIQMKELIQQSTGFGNQFEERYYLLMDNEHVLYKTDEFPQGMEAELANLEENDYKIIKAGGNHYFAVMGTIPDYGWKYVQMVLYNDIYDAMTGSLYIFLLVMILGAGFSIILSYGLVNYFTIHISILIDKMQGFNRNNIQIPVCPYNYSNRKDELGMLHQKFDEMAADIISLIQNDYTNQILIKDARLKALEAQIDPHFLYNVLQSVSWSAKAIGDIRIPKIVDALGKMLRITLSPEDDIFTVKKETEFVLYYVTIQQFRFEGQLDFKMNIPEMIMDINIPKLTIQPLVENAIRYSMEEHEEVCYIEVIGQINETSIEIEVRNSGSAFEDNLLAKLESKQVEPGGFGIGLLNIQKRLQLFGGNAAYLQLKNVDNMAVACIHLPIHDS